MSYTSTILVIVLVVAHLDEIAGFVAVPRLPDGGSMLMAPASSTRTLGVVPITSLFMATSSDDNEDSPSIQYVNKQEMEEIIEDFEQGGSGYCVLDVRDEAEVEATGKLADGVITCPLPKLQELHAFELHPRDFEEEFSFSKPHFDDTLVFTCAAGKRAQLAAELAAMDGYPNIVVYKGGSNEWFGGGSA